MKVASASLRGWVLAALGAIAGIFGTGIVHAYPGGITGYSGASGSTCASCHGGASPPAATLSGPATLGVGATGTYTLNMQRSGSNSFGGLDVSASGGTLSSSMSGLKIMNGEITHSSPSSVPIAGATWTFDWQAPSSPGTYTLYGAVASTNGSGTSNDGTAAKTLTVTVTALNQSPVAQISGPMTATEGTSVSFSGSGSTDPDGSVVSYDWNFGDGVTGAGASVSHVFTVGTFSVVLTVTDNAGATNSITQAITISPASQPQPPIADPAGPYTGTVGNAVSFSGSGSTDPDGSIVSYLWDFGDGTTASTQSPTHVYTAAGTYLVQLSVTDNSGMSGSTSTSATISAPTTSPGGAGGDHSGKPTCKKFDFAQHGRCGRGKGDDDGEHDETDEEKDD